MLDGEDGGLRIARIPEAILDPQSVILLLCAPMR
jgi:hypothetical protein